MTNAFGLVIPDYKLFVYIPLKPNVSSTFTEIYHTYAKFFGPESSVVPYTTMYYGVSGPLEPKLPRFSILRSGGLVREERTAKRGRFAGMAVGTYSKREGQTDVAERVAMASLSFISRLNAGSHKPPALLQDVFNSLSNNRNGAIRRPYVTYKMIELLSENPTSSFSLSNLADAISVPKFAVGQKLLQLSRLGIVDYNPDLPYLTISKELAIKDTLVANGHSDRNHIWYRRLAPLVNGINEAFKSVKAEGSSRLELSIQDLLRIGDKKGVKENDIRKAVGLLGGPTTLIQKDSNLAKANDTTLAAYAQYLRPIKQSILEKKVTPELDAPYLAYTKNREMLAAHLRRHFNVYLSKSRSSV
ncbi:MAG TPA: hypothetical protein VND15_04115 [Candidatus Acidoferrales bacterium]|nr:hypothetical protein [Candidatus Acidoferrales bacterium]